MSVGNSLILVGLLLIAVCFFAALLVIRSPGAVPDDLGNVPLTRVFPFEIVKGRYKYSLILLWIGVQFGVALVGAGYFVYARASFVSFCLLGGCALTIGFALAIITIPADSNLKAHLTVFILYLCCLGLLEGIEAFALLIFRPFFESEAVAYIYMAVMLICAALTFFQGFSPKLRNWAQLERKDNEDGTVTYIRGDNFTMPITQLRLFIIEAASTFLFGAIVFISILLI